MIALATEILHRTLMITAFVAVMMLIVEYLNVQSRGLFMRALSSSPLFLAMKSAGVFRVYGQAGGGPDSSSTIPVVESRRGYPCAYPTGKTAIREGLVVR